MNSLLKFVKENLNKNFFYKSIRENIKLENICGFFWSFEEKNFNFFEFFACNDGGNKNFRQIFKIIVLLSILDNLMHSLKNLIQ